MSSDLRRCDCPLAHDLCNCPPATDRAPGWLATAGNFVAAAGAHVAAGMRTVDEETLRSRLAICRECDRYEVANDVCRVCGCHMAIKASWSEQECPLGKWPAET